KKKAVMSDSKPPEASKKSTVVGPTRGWSKVEAHATKKMSLKRKEV
ncbi:hypothetical protein A2U01_0072799, partial [Trifolium medium]|nr:hypothetical protein [Trifolium medium]